MDYASARRSAGSDANQDSGFDPMDVAADQADDHAVSVLRAYGATPSLVYPAATLCNHARTGNLSGLTHLLTSGACAVERDVDPWGRSALHVACSVGHEAVASALLAHGADIQRLDAHGNSPLRDAGAIQCSRLSVVCCAPAVRLPISDHLSV